MIKIFKNPILKFFKKMLKLTYFEAQRSCTADWNYRSTMPEGKAGGVRNVGVRGRVGIVRGKGLVDEDWGRPERRYPEVSGPMIGPAEC